MVDGTDLAQVDPAWLRRQIGVVLQENVLFNCSVRDNIALADPAISMERVIAGMEKKTRVMSERERKTVASHESGHALVAALLPNADPVAKITARARCSLPAP